MVIKTTNRWGIWKYLGEGVLVGQMAAVMATQGSVPRYHFWMLLDLSLSSSEYMYGALTNGHYWDFYIVSNTGKICKTVPIPFNRYDANCIAIMLNSWVSSHDFVPCG